MTSVVCIPYQKMSVFKKIILVLINSAIILAKYDEHVKFLDNDTLDLYSECEMISPYNNGENVRGICVKLNECTDIITQNIQKSTYNHTVCGYDGTVQIVCCSWNVINNATIIRPVLARIGITEINLDSEFNCTTKYSGESGVLKFIEDCPELDSDTDNNGLQEYCTHEICKGLVCCPIRSKTTRYNPICKNVDRPDEEILFRLEANMRCTVQGLNQTGTYQRVCGAYDRHEISNGNAIAVCMRGFCTYFYCCPILSTSDQQFCTRKIKEEFLLIDFIGPKCTDSLTQLPGQCRHLYDCPSYRKGRAKKEFDVCGVDCCTNFYCCPEENNVLQPISMQKCLKYQNKQYKKQVQIENLGRYEPNTVCSNLLYPIVGGLRAHPGIFPHMAALGYIFQNEIQWNCGASLISEQFVLTAAHCLESPQVGPVKVVRMGSLYLENVTKVDECAEDFGVKRIISHPSYNPNQVYNDIGLIELDREVKFNYHIRPVCLPTSSKIPKRLIGMGWGLLGPSEEKSDTLYFAYMEPYTYAECNKSYEHNLNRRARRGIDDITQVCVGSRTNIQSTCSGDSGGPLISPLQDLERIFEIIGITSFGTVCGFANSPGVYTKVYPYINWIEGLIWS